MNFSAKILALLYYCWPDFFFFDLELLPMRAFTSYDLGYDMFMSYDADLYIMGIIDFSALLGLLFS